MLTDPMIQTTVEPTTPKACEITAKPPDLRCKDMRIAYLAPTLVRGDYWQPIFRELTRLVPNTVVITSNWPGFLPGYEDKFKVQALQGYKYLMPQMTSTGAEVGILWAPPSVVWKLMEFRPHVIFTSAFSIWTLYALLYKALTGCRVVIGWEGNAPTTTYLDRPMRLKARRLMAHFTDAAYTNTREGLEYLRTVIRMPDAKLSQHPFQVPEASALRLGSKAPPLNYDRHPVFLFVASIIKRKGWRYLIDATIRLKMSVGSSFSVVLVGAGSELEALRAMVSANHLAEVVEVVGHVPYEVLGRYFRACDVFVLPTLEDTWGMVVLESMVYGKAVLCSQFAGSREMVEHGVNGFLFDPHHPDELFDFMQRFVLEPELSTAFGAKSSEIIAPYTPERSGAALTAIAEKLVTPPPGSTRANRTRASVKFQQPSSDESHTRADVQRDNLRIVTTSWDDGDPADLRLAELLRSRGVRGTFYVPISYNGRETLTHADLRSLSSEGFEVGAHGYSHKLLGGLSAADLAAEIEPCKPTLEGIVGQEVRMFCYPQGRYDARAIRALKSAGYRGARTVRMLATGSEFEPFEMPTTVQVYPHSRSVYFRNVARGGKISSLITCLAFSNRLTNWLDLGQRLFDSVLENGGIWHLYGHSWELDEQGLWKDFEQLLDYVCKRDDVMYVANGETLQLMSIGKQSSVGSTQP